MSKNVTFRAFKKPIEQTFEIIKKDCVVTSREGDTAAKAGDVLMFDVEGGKYRIAKEVFEKTYEVTKQPGSDGKNGSACKVRILVDVYQFDKDDKNCTISNIDGSVFRGEPGHYVVTSRVSGKIDQWVVKPEVFEATYERLAPIDLSIEKLRQFYQIFICPEDSLAETAHKLEIHETGLQASWAKFREYYSDLVVGRQNARWVFTARGEAFFAHAKELIDQHDQFLNLYDPSKVADNKVYLAMSGLVPKSAFYKIVSTSPIVSNGAIELQVSESQVSSIKELITQKKCDFAFALEPLQTDNGSLENLVLQKLPVHFFVSLKTPLGEKIQGLMTSQNAFPEVLKHQPFLMPGPAGTSYGQTKQDYLRTCLERFFKERRIKPKVVSSYQDMSLIELAGKHGQGVFALPIGDPVEYAKQNDLLHLGDVRNSAGEQELLSLYCIFLKNLPLVGSEPLRAFLNSIKNVQM